MTITHQRLSYLAIFFVAFVWYGCKDKGADAEADLTVNQETAIQYFKDIALGFEFGNASEVTRRWASDIYIFVTGKPDDLLLNELDDILDDLNRLLPETAPDLAVTDDSLASNFLVFLGPGDDYARIDSRAINLVGSNFGLFFVRFNAANVITSASMYVDTERPSEIQKRHLLREELTQSLGLAKDSSLFPDSIFQQSFSGVATVYNRFDEAIIQMLYHPKMRTGLDEDEVDPILREIVTEIID